MPLSLTTNSRPVLSITSIIGVTENDTEKNFDEMLIELSDRIHAGITEVVSTKVLIQKKYSSIEEGKESYMDLIEHSNEVAQSYFKLMGSDKLKISELTSLIEMPEDEQIGELKIRWLKNHGKLDNFKGLSDVFISKGYEFPSDTLDAINELNQAIGETDGLPMELWNNTRRVFEGRQADLVEIEKRFTHYASEGNLSVAIATHFLCIALNTLIPNPHNRRAFLDGRVLDKRIFDKLKVSDDLSPLEVDTRKIVEIVPTIKFRKK